MLELFDWLQRVREDSQDRAICIKSNNLTVHFAHSAKSGPSSKSHAQSAPLNPGLTQVIHETVNDKLVAGFAGMTPLASFCVLVRLKEQWHTLG